MKKILIATTLLALIPTFANADSPDSMRASLKEQKQERWDATTTLNNSINVYRDIVLRSPHGAVPSSVQANAKCIAVFPNTITAAIVVGGTRGQGVVSCKNDTTWSTPAIVNLTAASLGAQIGGKSSDLVMFINNDTAVSALKRGTLKVGADASVAVGKYDSSADYGPAGIIAYQRTEGGYVGASIGTGNISIDESETRNLYGKDMIALKLLDGVQTAKAASSDSFTKLLPSA